MTPAPIYIHGWDESNNYWSATRAGEPSFQAVQDLEDAYAAALTRGCEIVMSDQVWIDMNGGLAPTRPSDVRRTG